MAAIQGPGIELLVRGRDAPLGGHDQLARFDEGGCDTNGAVQQAPRVIAQVQHQALGRLFLRQVGQHPDQIRSGAVLELADAHVRNVMIEHLAAYAAGLDHFPHDMEFERLGTASALDRQLDRGTGFAAHFLDGVIQAHALGGFTVDLGDQVTGQDAGTRGRRVFDRRNHFGHAVLGADLDPQPPKTAPRDVLHLLVAFLVQIHRMRVEVGKQAFDCIIDQRLVRYGLDIAGLDRPIDIGELLQRLDRQGLSFLGSRRNAKADQDAPQKAHQNPVPRSIVSSAHAHS